MTTAISEIVEHRVVEYRGISQSIEVLETAVSDGLKTADCSVDTAQAECGGSWKTLQPRFDLKTTRISQNAVARTAVYCGFCKTTAVLHSRTVSMMKSPRFCPVFLRKFFRG